MRVLQDVRSFFPRNALLCCPICSRDTYSLSVPSRQSLLAWNLERGPTWQRLQRATTPHSSGYRRASGCFKFRTTLESMLPSFYRTTANVKMAKSLPIVILQWKYHGHSFHPILTTFSTTTGHGIPQGRGHSATTAKHVYGVEVDHLPESSSDTLLGRENIRALVGHCRCWKWLATCPVACVTGKGEASNFRHQERDCRVEDRGYSIES